MAANGQFRSPVSGREFSISVLSKQRLGSKSAETGSIRLPSLASATSASYAIGSISLATLLYFELASFINWEVLLGPSDPLSRDRLLCDLIVHEHEVVRLAQEIADRATGPEEASHARKIFMLECTAQDGFGITAAVGRRGIEELLRVVANPSDKRVNMTMSGSVHANSSIISMIGGVHIIRLTDDRRLPHQRERQPWQQRAADQSPASDNYHISQR
jgi:hypothetical protein